jgi:hypothetical protein
MTSSIGELASQFCVPPGWPTPPTGWTPPEGWAPEPSWPPAPDGWIFWRRSATANIPQPADEPRSTGSTPGGYFNGGKSRSTSTSRLAPTSAVAPIAMETYKVTYKGGHPDLPKSRVGEIRLSLTPEAFVLNATMTSKKFWKALTIPYADVGSVEIVARVVSTFEGLAGGLNSRQLNQDNNIHIEYASPNGNWVLLRFEMLSGITVMGQAGKCREFEDRLRALGITRKFKQVVGNTPSVAEDSVATHITKLAQLRDLGILTETEFNAKKTELLARL